MGDSGSAHEVGTFSSRADDLHIGEIRPVVYSRNRPSTWSTSIHSVEHKPEVYSALLEGFLKGYGNTTDHEYNLPPTDRWSIREDYTVLEDMMRACVLDHKGSWEEHLPLVEFTYNNSY